MGDYENRNDTTWVYECYSTKMCLVPKTIFYISYPNAFVSYTLTLYRRSLFLFRISRKDLYILYYCRLIRGVSKTVVTYLLIFNTVYWGTVILTMGDTFKSTETTLKKRHFLDCMDCTFSVTFFFIWNPSNCVLNLDLANQFHLRRIFSFLNKY